jgi:hypothetical protein
MIVKKILLIPLLFIICQLDMYGHESKNFSSGCVGKVAQERPQLFVQAEEHEKNLINAQAECLQNNDCDTDYAVRRAKNQLLYTIAMLKDYLEELEEGKSGACNVCEKNEATDIKDRLTELLKSNQ